MCKKIVIIDHEPLTIRRRRIFYIEELRERGFDVEFWDCSELFLPNATLPDILNADYHKEFNTLDQLKNELNVTNINSTIFIVEVFNNWKNRKLFKLLSDMGCYKVKLELYATTSITDISIFQKIKHSSIPKLCRVAINRIKSMRYKLYTKRHHIKGFDKQICSGNNPSIDIHINHPDWEQFAHTTPFENDRPYAVFIDQYYPLHPDFANHKDKLGDAEHYQASIKNFFDRFEQHTNLEVIIAAHPKANYSSNELGNRKYITYKTAELVKSARCVLIHSSSAIAYAIIADKPIALIDNNEHSVSAILSFHIRRLSKLLSLPIYNIDHCDITTIKPTRISNSARENYIYSYLTSPAIEDKSTLDILCDFFRSC